MAWRHHIMAYLSNIGHVCNVIIRTGFDQVFILAQKLKKRQHWSEIITKKNNQMYKNFAVEIGGSGRPSSNTTFDWLVTLLQANQNPC